MFRDTSEELARLEAELLAEEEPEQEQQPLEEEDVEEDLPWRFDDTRPAEGRVIYQNYSNDYGKGLRNYASGYRAYNADDSDEDLDTYAEDVYQGKKEKGILGLAVTACLLALAIAAVVILWFAKARGLLG